MDKVTIESKILKASFKLKGAETASLVDKRSGAEIIWQGSEKSWKGQAYNLFPFCGKMFDLKYTHEGKEYYMPPHGFARDYVFEVSYIKEDTVTLKLSSSAKTKEVYPFDFDFYVKYTLSDSLLTEYIVDNTGDKAMYFAVGGHPGFALPATELDDTTDISGNSLVFDRPQNPELLIKPVDFITGSEKISGLKEIKLDKSFFRPIDTKIYKGLDFESITICRKDGVKVRFSQFPSYVTAVWTKPQYGAFVCIEPWWGCPDNESPVRELKDKPGINALSPGKVFRRSYTITVE